MTKEEKRKYFKTYKRKDPEAYKKKRQEYYLKNREKLLVNAKARQEANHEIYLEYQKANYRKNRVDRIKKASKRQKDKWPEVCVYQKQYQVNYHKKYPHIKAWRNLIHNTLSRLGKDKEGHTIELLGFSAVQLKENIISKFKIGMTWDNYGEWEIDHIQPVSSFAPDTPQSVVNSLENLQPLWWFDNISKGDRYTIKNRTV